MKSAYKKANLLKTIVSIVDWCAFNIALLTCFLIGLWPDLGTFMVWLIANVSYFIVHEFIFITLHHRWASIGTIMRNVFRSSIMIVIIDAAILGMAGMHVPGLSIALAVAAIIFAITITERFIMRDIIKRMRHEGRDSIKVVIIGNCGNADKIIRVMGDMWNGYRLLGIFNDSNPHYVNASGKEEDGGNEIPYLGKINEAADWIADNHVDEIYIGLEEEKTSELKQLVKLCEHLMVRVYYISKSYSSVQRKTTMIEFGDTYVETLYKEPLMNSRNRFLKRSFDIVVSACFLCTLFPIIYIIVMIISKTTMPGPVFFKQKRTGYDGKDFYCYKFRSMKVNNDSDKVQATKGDPRVTKWGKIMRHTNIDELPQFINVLKGDMSIVGPRPHMLAHTEYYSNRISDYMIRHLVRPGITGWAQTHGERGETQTVDDMARRVEKDIWYIEHWYFWLDIQIMIKTIHDAIVGDKKAY